MQQWLVGVSEATDRAVRAAMIPTALERRWGSLLLETMYPSHVDPRIRDDGESLDHDRSIVDMAEHAPTVTVMGLRMAIVAAGLMPIVTERKLATIATVSDEARLRAVNAASESSLYPLRSLMTVLKTLGAMSFASASRLRPDGRARTTPVLARIKLRAET